MKNLLLKPKNSFVHVVILKDSPWATLSYKGINNFFSFKNSSLQEKIFPDVVLHRIEKSSTELRTLLDTIKGDRNNILVAVGNWCSTMSADILEASKGKLPLFFCGVSNASQTMPHFTPGIEGIQHSFRKQAQMLKQLFPHLEKIALSYLVDLSSEKFMADTRLGIEIFKQELLTQSIRGIDTPISSKKNVDLQLHHLSTQGICLFRDTEHSQLLPDIISYAERNNTLLYASDIGSVYRGVGIGFGDTGYEYGWETAKLINQYLNGEKNIDELGVVKLHSPGKLSINNYCIGRQGLNFDQQTLHLIRAGLIG